MPYKHEDLLDEVLTLNEQYGAGGKRLEDAAAVALLDVPPEITPALQMERYLTALRVADGKWKAAHSNGGQ